MTCIIDNDARRSDHVAHLLLVSLPAVYEQLSGFISGVRCVVTLNRLYAERGLLAIGRR